MPGGFFVFSAPRVRGGSGFAGASPYAHWATPADAGTTSPRQPAVHADRGHPRVCGDLFVAILAVPEGATHERPYQPGNPRLKGSVRGKSW